MEYFFLNGMAIGNGGCKWRPRELGHPSCGRGIAMSPPYDSTPTMYATCALLPAAAGCSRSRGGTEEGHMLPVCHSRRIGDGVAGGFGRRPYSMRADNSSIGTVPAWPATARDAGAVRGGGRHVRDHQRSAPSPSS